MARMMAPLRLRGRGRAADEALVDLDLVERRLLQIAERANSRCRNRRAPGGRRAIFSLAKVSSVASLSARNTPSVISSSSRRGADAGIGRALPTTVSTMSGR